MYITIYYIKRNNPFTQNINIPQSAPLSLETSKKSVQMFK